MTAHAIKIHGGSRGIAPPILNFDTKWRFVVSFAPQERNTLLGEPRTGLDVEKRKIPFTCQESKHKSAVVQPIS
jgi:hypothetical protein